MSFHRPTRRQLSTHEAGHAYAYAALAGYDCPTFMGLGVEEDGSHHGWSTRGTLLYREVPFRQWPEECRSSVEWQADVEIAIAIAGPMSEFRHSHRSRCAAVMIANNNVDVFLQPGAFDTDGDFNRIRAILAYIEEPRPAERLSRMIFVADEVLASNWTCVCALARMLLERGQLGEEELAEWFETNPARRHRYVRNANGETAGRP